MPSHQCYILHANLMHLRLFLCYVILFVVKNPHKIKRLFSHCWFLPKQNLVHAKIFCLQFPVDTVLSDVITKNIWYIVVQLHGLLAWKVMLDLSCSIFWCVDKELLHSVCCSWRYDEEMAKTFEEDFSALKVKWIIRNAPWLRTRLHSWSVSSYIYYTAHYCIYKTKSRNYSAVT